MESKPPISKKLDYLRIILFIPLAWVAYNISANFIAEISSKELITTIGSNFWRYGFDAIQFIVFVSIGTIVAPGALKLLSGVLSILNYGIAAIWSIWILPSIFDVTVGNLAIHYSLNYFFILIPMLISILILMKKYRKNFESPKLI